MVTIDNTFERSYVVTIELTFERSYVVTIDNSLLKEVMWYQ